MKDSVKKTRWTQCQLPSHLETLCTYFIEIAEKNESVSPPCQARSAIKHFHLIKYPDTPSPTDHQRVKLVMDSIQRRFSKPVKKVAPMTIHILRQLLDNLIGQDLRNNTTEAPLTNWRLAAKR